MVIYCGKQVFRRVRGTPSGDVLVIHGCHATKGRKRLRETAEKVNQAADLARSLLALYPAGGRPSRRRRQMERVTELAVLGSADASCGQAGS